MTVISLATAYPCKSGGPMLRAVDTAIFTLRYFTRCMACGFCRDSCCRHGVDVDLENAARLKALPQAFHDRIGVPDSAWFTDTITQDAEFPGGRHVRTQVRRGACVFLNRAARGCHIHAYALEAGMDYHDVKPLVSTLFPATFEQGVLAPSAEVADGSLVCAGEGSSVYAGARDELLYYFGPGLVAELDLLREKAGRTDG
jgi:hypothetical protein